MADQVLDTSGLSCPLPILKAKKAMRQLAPGDVLEVIATDPGAVDDFRTFCRVTGHELLDEVIGGDVFRFRIRHTTPAVSGTS
ncbi:MAG: sulfurtransferase TusA family protein [Pseudomonadota bacterium]